MQEKQGARGRGHPAEAGKPGAEKTDAQRKESQQAESHCPRQARGLPGERHFGPVPGAEGGVQRGRARNRESAGKPDSAGVGLCDCRSHQCFNFRDFQADSQKRLSQICFQEILRSPKASGEIRAAVREAQLEVGALRQRARLFEDIDKLNRRILEDLRNAQAWDKFSMEVLLKKSGGAEPNARAERDAGRNRVSAARGAQNHVSGLLEFDVQPVK